MAKDPSKICEKCNRPAIVGERFCLSCKQHVMNNARNAGYFQHIEDDGRTGRKHQDDDKPFEEY